MNKKSMAMKMRNALVKNGASESVIAAALAVMNPPKFPAVKLTGDLRKRIVALLDKPGAKCVLIRNKGGVRAYTPGSLAKLSEVALTHKPYLKAAAARRRRSRWHTSGVRSRAGAEPRLALATRRRGYP